MVSVPPDLCAAFDTVDHYIVLGKLEDVIAKKDRAFNGLRSLFV